MGNNISSIKLGSDTFDIRTYGTMTISEGIITAGTTCPNFSLIPNAKLLLKVDADYRGFINHMNINNTGNKFVYNGTPLLYYADFGAGDILEFVYANNFWHVLNYNPNQVSISFKNLKTLCSEGRLIPGMKYRIIDYNPIINPTYMFGLENYYSAPATTHTSFDIIVTAISDTELSHDATAAPSSWDTAAVTYYESNNIDVSKWKIKYDINSDPTKHNWVSSHIAKSADGKIVLINPTKRRFGATTTVVYNTNIPNHFLQSTTTGTTGTLKQITCSLSLVTDYSKNSPTSYTVDTYDNSGGGSVTATISSSNMYLLPDGKRYYSNIDILVTASASNMILIPAGAMSSLATAGVAHLLKGVNVTNPRVSECTISENEDDCGVIYYLEDEFGNSCPYDFKNIRVRSDSTTNYPTFAVFGLTNANGSLNSSPNDATVYTKNVTNCKVDVSHCPEEISINMAGPYFTIPTNRVSIGQNNKCSDIYFGVDSFNNKVTLSEVTAKGVGVDDNFYGIYIGYGCKDNTISNSHNTLGRCCVNNTISGTYNVLCDCCDENVITGNSNILGNNCTLNTLNSYNNTLGNNCVSNTITGLYNSLGNNCISNTITGDSNSFKNYCVSNNVMGRSNSFGNKCISNTIGFRAGESNNNSFGNDCFNNALGDYCTNNSFGNGVNNCGIIVSATITATSSSYCRNNTFEDGVSFVKVVPATTGATSSSQLQNVCVHRGCNFTNYTYPTVPRNREIRIDIINANPLTITI